MDNKTIRVDPRFNNELEEIRKERLNRKVDKKKISSRAITSMIPRHKLWQKKIKEDIINHKFEEETSFEEES